LLKIKAQNYHKKTNYTPSFPPLFSITPIFAGSFGFSVLFRIASLWLAFGIVGASFGLAVLFGYCEPVARS
jgi:hypothetical protein